MTGYGSAAVGPYARFQAGQARQPAIVLPPKRKKGFGERRRIWVSGPSAPGERLFSCQTEKRVFGPPRRI